MLWCYLARAIIPISLYKACIPIRCVSKMVVIKGGEKEMTYWLGLTPMQRYNIMKLIKHSEKTVLGQLREILQYIKINKMA